VDIGGRTQIIEYSDLPQDVAERQDAGGSLHLWAGNIAVHAFDLAFLAREAADAEALPIHRARKAVPYVEANGEEVTPREPNAVKFERFIFDLLPRARHAAVVEVAAGDAFAPVKNAASESVDTPVTAQAAMVQRDTALLRAADIEVAEGVAVEINPRWALDVPEIVRRAPPGLRVVKPTYFA
jgi:UDP-N-acetylglucosamine/UDP-N-acetylgalactosamine diphosphorylase